MKGESSAFGGKSFNEQNAQTGRMVRDKTKSERLSAKKIFLLLIDNVLSVRQWVLKKFTGDFVGPQIKTKLT